MQLKQYDRFSVRKGTHDVSYNNAILHNFRIGNTRRSAVVLIFTKFSLIIRRRQTVFHDKIRKEITQRGECNRRRKRGERGQGKDCANGIETRAHRLNRRHALDDAAKHLDGLLQGHRACACQEHDVKMVQAGLNSSRNETLNSVAGKDLQGFAEKFRALVDQGSRELEEVRNLEYNMEPHTPLDLARIRSLRVVAFRESVSFFSF